MTSDFRFAGGVVALLLFPAVLTAAEPVNLLANGSFEKTVEVNMSRENPHYKPLFERNVSLPTGEKTPMPEGVYLNPADGWLGAGNRFEYVLGREDAEVHTGSRAVRITSPAGFSAISFHDRVSVVEGVGLDERAVAVGKPIPFSFWARGKGTVRVNCYLYGHKHENLYDYARLRAVQPEQFSVDAPDQWQRFEGALTIRDAAVNHFVFVIAVQGQVTLDDVALRAP